MRPALTCQVSVDGRPLADTGADLAASMPTVLTGLKVDWGRASVVDQPGPASATFTVADIGGDADFLGRLHVGAPIAVTATGALPTDGDPFDVAVDGDFTHTHTHGRVAVLAGPATPTIDAGTLTLDSPAGPASLAIPPGPWSGVVDAWDPIPAASPGQTWTVTLRITTGPGVTATLAPALYRTGDRPGRPPTPLGGSVTVPGNATTVASATTTIADGTPYGWVGAALTMTPTSWLDWSGPWTSAEPSWAALGRLTVADLTVLAPPTAVRTVAVFSGRITDLTAKAARPGITVAVAALDHTADLANDYIGDQPWPAQTITTRAARILDLAGRPVIADIDPRPGAMNVSGRDVDNAAAAGLLTELATSADAVLWAAEHPTRGSYLWMEDTSQRAALGVLALDTDVGLVVITGNTRPAAGIVLSACDLLADQVTWGSDVADVITRVDATWAEQTLDEDGKLSPTERHVLVVDEAAEDPARGNLGVRRAGYTTALISEADAADVAGRVLYRSAGARWHATGLTWDTATGSALSDTDRATALDLLDGTRRIGLPAVVTDLPRWSPGGDALGIYVEGGTYTYTGGRWILAVDASPAGATGYSATWEDLDPAWTWPMMDTRAPAPITWWAAWGVTADYASPRWGQLDPHPWTADTHLWADYYGPQRKAAA